jgi:hypothetical protein
MVKYKCKNCGYNGDKIIFQFNDYGYCVATNQEDPEYSDEPPKWVKNRALGEAIIGEPVGCPKCQAWGVHIFETVN